MSSWKCWPFCLGPNVLNRYDTFSQDYTTLWVLFTEWTTIIALDHRAGHKPISNPMMTPIWKLQTFQMHYLFSFHDVNAFHCFIASIRHMVIKGFIKAQCKCYRMNAMASHITGKSTVSLAAFSCWQQRSCQNSIWLRLCERKTADQWISS